VVDEAAAAAVVAVVVAEAAVVVAAAVVGFAVVRSHSPAVLLQVRQVTTYPIEASSAFLQSEKLEIQLFFCFVTASEVLLAEQLSALAAVTRAVASDQQVHESWRARANLMQAAFFVMMAWKVLLQLSRLVVLTLSVEMLHWAPMLDEQFASTSYVNLAAYLELRENCLLRVVPARVVPEHVGLLPFPPSALIKVEVLFEKSDFFLALFDTSVMNLSTLLC